MKIGRLDGIGLYWRVGRLDWIGLEEWKVGRVEDKWTDIARNRLGEPGRRWKLGRLGKP